MTGLVPYDADHVTYVHERGTVAALYIPDPEQARNPRAVWDNILDRALTGDVEIIATAERHYRRDGADFSGWIVTSRGDYSDPISTKPEAMKNLRGEVATYFKHRGEPE